MATAGFPQDSAAANARRLPVPEGEWKLLSYTITHANQPARASKPARRSKPNEGKARLASGSSLAQLVDGTVAGRPSRPSLGNRSRGHGPGDRRLQSGQGRQGRDGRVSLRPSVQAHGDGQILRQDGNRHKQLSLEMSLVGSAGEVCTNMMVNGGRPAKPEFTITDPKGKVVATGQLSSMAEASLAGTRGEYHRSWTKSITSA